MLHKNIMLILMSYLTGAIKLISFYLNHLLIKPYKIMALIQGDVTGFMVKPFNMKTLKKQLDWIQAKTQAA